MSQSPTDVKTPANAEDYLNNWSDLGGMISQGFSFSGRERNRCFLNTGGQQFADASYVTGLDFIDDGRGTAVVDWDHDGDLDLWISNRTGPRVRMLQNRSPEGNQFVAVRLQGTRCNRDAIGARVQLHLQTTISGAESSSDGQRKTLIRTLRAGEGFLSQSSKWVHFGLGTDWKIDRLTVHWPSQDVESFENILPNQRYSIVQGSQLAKAVNSERLVQLQASQLGATASSDRSRTLLTHRLALPDLEFRDFNGETRQLSNASVTPESRSGTLINLWASWCRPCLEEFDQLSKEWSLLEPSKLRVVALCTDPLQEDADLSTARSLVQESNWPFEFGLANEQVIQALTTLNNDIFYLTQPLPLPCSLLIDQEGKVAAIYKGPVEPQQLAMDIERLEAAPEELARAAFPFPGRQIIRNYNPSPLSLATAYYEAGYLQDARRELIRFLKNIAEISDFDRLTDVMEGSLRPGAIHESRVPRHTQTNSSSHQTTERTRLKQALQDLQRQTTIKGFRLLANIERDRGQPKNQLRILRQLVTLQPDSNTAKANLAVALFQQGQTSAADSILQDISSRVSDDAGTMVLLGQTYMKTGQVPSAVEWFRKALEQKSDSPEIQLNLGIALQLQGSPLEAIQQYEQILATTPEANEAANNLAWLYATHNDASVRNPTRALHLARDLCDRTSYTVPPYLGTLAAALAQGGKFDEAIRLAETAASIARGRGDNEITKSLEKRAILYRQGKPVWLHSKGE